MKASRKLLLMLLVTLIFISFACSKPQEIKTAATVKDKDGNAYRLMKIDTQEWLADNLNTEHYRNGDVIPQVQSPEDWASTFTGAWCYYNNDTKNGKTYGKLYNWYAVKDKRGLAPEGYHIPSDEEWKKLTDYLAGAELAGKRLKDTILWRKPNDGATNLSGFSALPAGSRDDRGLFDYIEEYGKFWTINEIEEPEATLYGVTYFDKSADKYHADKRYGISVRCVKD